MLCDHALVFGQTQILASLGECVAETRVRAVARVGEGYSAPYARVCTASLPIICARQSGHEWTIQCMCGCSPEALEKRGLSPHPRILARVLPHYASNPCNWKIVACKVRIGGRVLWQSSAQSANVRARARARSHSRSYPEHLKLVVKESLQTHR